MNFLALKGGGKLQSQFFSIYHILLQSHEYYNRKSLQKSFKTKFVRGRLGDYGDKYFHSPNTKHHEDNILSYNYGKTVFSKLAQGSTIEIS